MKIKGLQMTKNITFDEKLIVDCTLHKHIKPIKSILENNQIS